MDKQGVRKVVSGWLKETKLEEDEEFATFPEHNHLTIRIINAEKLYRDERKKGG